MPTFSDPHADAREAAEAVRGLAHATQSLDDPGQLYSVIGELMATTRNLSQVLGQLARAHQQHVDRATTDDGDRQAGRQLTFDAASALREAATLVSRADAVLDTASNRAGRIAWASEQAPDRWVSIVFLQGDEADPVLDIVDRQGADAAIGYLSGWDQGEETVSDAMENGYVYDAAPQTPADELATRGDYALTYSPTYGYVGLTRRIPAAEPEDQAVRPRTATGSAWTRQYAGGQGREVSEWFRPDAISEVADARGLSL